MYAAGIAYHEVLLARLAGTSARGLLVASVMVTLGTALAMEDLASFLWGGASVGVPYRLPSLVGAGRCSRCCAWCCWPWPSP